MNKELQININFEDGSYTAKYNPKNTSNQKAIEELKRIQSLFYGTQIQLYVENRIKELESNNDNKAN